MCSTNYKKMTKEDAIKLAWGVFWDRLTENQKEHALKNNGNVQIGYDNEQSKLYRDIIKSKLFLTQPVFPKSLKGINDNNGWIKDYNNLPNESFDCYFITKYSDNTIMRGFFNFNSKIVYGTHREYDVDDITHYRLIEKPKLPLY